jgi:segregation and condensation protein B
MSKDNEHRAVIEAALFMSARSMDVKELSSIIASSPRTTKRLVDELAALYTERSAGLSILETGDGYRLSVRNEVVDAVAHLAERTEISEAEIRTLSVIAYYQPLLQSKLVKMRGNNAYTHVSALMEKRYISGKANGRSRLLTTTERFRSHFAVSGEELGHLALKRRQQKAP